MIVSRLDYLNKMKQLISDNTKFKQLKQNPTKSREESLSAYLRKLRNEKIIDDATFHKILPSGCFVWPSKGTGVGNVTLHIGAPDI